jgi:glutamine synthetase
MSLRDAAGHPIIYAAGEPYGLSVTARHFFAGVLANLSAICAITARSPVSYLRLTPNRWAPTRVDIATRERGASLRICPVFGAADAAETARQYNVEFRPADATASPYLALGAIIFAGIEGLARRLELPPEHNAGEWKTQATCAEGEAVGAMPLPASLDEALDALERIAPAHDWFGRPHFDARRAESVNAKTLTPAILCERYAKAY